MATTAGDGNARIVPKRRKRHHSYDESVDEPAKLLENEPVEIEEATPAEENEPVEGAKENDKSDMAPFEE